MRTTFLPTFSDAMLMLAETASPAELARLIWSFSDLARQPRGSGEPVIVLPGFATDDSSTWVLRRYLRSLGYRVYGWRIGFNHGDLVSLLPVVTELARSCASRRRRRVRLVGWSLGGLLAREVARDVPWLVDRVITMGSPTCIPRHEGARRWFSLFGHDLDSIADALERRSTLPLRVPVTAIHARWDGIVAPCDCVDRCVDVEHVEVGTTHLGLGLNADVYRIVAERLAAPASRFEGATNVVPISAAARSAAA